MQHTAHAVLVEREDRAAERVQHRVLDQLDRAGIDGGMIEAKRPLCNALDHGELIGRRHAYSPRSYSKPRSLVEKRTVVNDGSPMLVLLRCPAPSAMLPLRCPTR